MASGGHATSDSGDGHPALASALRPDPVWGREAGRLPLPLPRCALKRGCRVRPQPQWPGQEVESVCHPVVTGPSAPPSLSVPMCEAVSPPASPATHWDDCADRDWPPTLLLSAHPVTSDPRPGRQATLHQVDASPAAGLGVGVLLTPPRDYRMQPGEEAKPRETSCRGVDCLASRIRGQRLQG